MTAPWEPRGQGVLAWQSHLHRQQLQWASPRMGVSLQEVWVQVVSHPLLQEVWVQVVSLQEVLGQVVSLQEVWVQVVSLQEVLGQVVSLQVVWVQVVSLQEALGQAVSHPLLQEVLGQVVSLQEELEAEASQPVGSVVAV
jgi:hypothetical protein